MVIALHSCDSFTSESKCTLPYLHTTILNNGHSYPEDTWILCQAMSRMEITISDGRLYSPIDSPETINISPLLFNYIMKIIDNTNNSDYSPGSRMRSNATPDNYSCVAYALAQWAGAPSFNEIDSWIREQYNLNGAVPTTRISEVLYHFWGSDFLWYSSNIPESMEWDASRTVGIYSASGGYGHMVNIVGVHSNGDYIVADYSIDSVPYRSIMRSDMLYVIQNTWADTTGAVDEIIDTLR